MPQDATPTPTDKPGRSRISVDSGVDRSRAFRRAGRHTAMVRSLRVILPLAAVGMFASYGIFMQRSISIGWGGKKIEIEKVEISREALVAHNPRYSGFDKNGGEFVVRAATGEQDLGQKGLVRLKTIDGQMTDINRSKTDLKATRGTYDSANNVFEMFERIDVVGQNGMTAELTQATVYTKENRIVSNEPVTVRMPTGVVRGKAMTLEQKQRKVLFTGGVIANLKQEPRPGAKSEARPDGKDGGVRGTAGIGQAGGTVDITSTQLLIDDTTKRAVFSGNVVAKQTDSTLETTELEVHYEGQPVTQAPNPESATAANPSATTPASPGAAANTQSRLSKLIAKSDVVLTRGLEKATGSSGEFDALADRATLMGPVTISAGLDRGATSDRADIDNKNDTILLTGNVVVTQQKNVLKGRRLLVDRKRGTMQLASPGQAGLPKGRISARLVQAETEAASAKKAGAATTAKAAPQGPFAGNMQGQPGQPVDIDSDTLDVDDKAKTAIFRGRVVAKQGDYTIATEELVANYTGESGLALAAAPAGQGTPPAGQAKSGDAKTAAQLQTVTAPRRVNITTKDGQQAQANAAVFDTKGNTALLTGDVILTQGSTVTRGNCARLDMNTGSMRILDACGFSATTAAATPGAATSGAATSGAATPGAAPGTITTGRAQLLLYPGLVKEQQQKDKADKAKAAAPAPSATPAARPAATATADPPPAKPAPASAQREGWVPFGN